MGCRHSGPLFEDGMGVHGQDLGHTSQREALRILSTYEQPITLQIEGQRACQRGLQLRTSDCSTQTDRLWDTVRGLGVTPGSAARINTYTDKPCRSHMTLPHDSCTASEYLPSMHYSMENMAYKNPGLASCVPQGQSCLLGCCNTNMEEPSSFLSQTEDEDFVTERPMGYLPLMHELDSGLGWTDGSLHQGELSGMETEEGMEEHTSRGGSPSSESFISSELSDSGFYSVSTGEFRRFQKLLERRIRLYRARALAPGDQRDGQKGRRELESIPETLTLQPQTVRPSRPAGPGVAHRCTMGTSAVQFRKAGSPCLSRCSSSTGSLFRLQPGTSSCSTPSCQRRAMMHRNPSASFLKRSSTLHRSAPHALERRRASHPASPDYCSTALHHHGRRLATELAERREQAQKRQPSCEVSTSPLHRGPTKDPRGALPREHCCGGSSSRVGVEKQGRSFSRDVMERNAAERNVMERNITERNIAERNIAERNMAREREKRFHTLGHSQDIHETWPKPANRCCQRGGLYSTLDNHSANSQKDLATNPRALRNQLLKERASRLADERGGVTTDEESHGEVKTGRYWNKTERRQHMLLAREQRLQQQHQARGGAPAPGDARYGSTVLELSHRKLSRLRNRKLLDSWTTVEELLAHGTRLGSTEEILCPSSLLSVTTV
ncbi:uncharacterized protein LOC133109527 isoform X1 [Conger conger]|uniref:uncharacterized protein LOC133109527 isoform X1 n=2 Tax=Conger conger TaxID=82655 RepID=UPI002A59AA3E|nr:uncharacterized protein LOC133109527 isoform X1 [Conger conger]